MGDRPNTIVRAKRSETPYFMMSRATAQDEKLSWAARGILTYLLSKPDDWRINVKDLQQGCGRDKVYGLLDELINNRYIVRSKTQSVEYMVHEVPLPENTEAQVGLPEIPDPEIPDPENPHRTYKRESQSRESTENTSDTASQVGEAAQSSQVDMLRWWENEAYRTKIRREGENHFLSRGIPGPDAVYALERVCNGTAKKWWDKFAYKGGSHDFLAAAEKEALKIKAERVFMERMTDSADQPSQPPNEKAPAYIAPPGTRWIYPIQGDHCHLVRDGNQPTTTLCGISPLPSYGGPGGKTQVQCAACLKATEKKPKESPAPRPRDLVFDAIALGSFGLSQVKGKIGGRIGALAKEVKDCAIADDKPTPDQLAELATNLTRMYAWYKVTFPDRRDAPAKAETICKYLQMFKPQTAAVVPPPNIVPIDEWYLGKDTP